MNLKRFAHSAGVIGLLTTLGLFKDSVHLRADNYRDQTNRKFKMSDLVPMSGNIALVLYKCHNGISKNVNETGKIRKTKVKGLQKGTIYKIGVLVNEVTVRLPCCHGESTCNMERFVRCFQKLSKCNFERLCNVLKRGKGRKKKKKLKKNKGKNKQRKNENERDY